MHCNNTLCPARLEPEIPCWEIARKFSSFHNVTNTCRDCIVYILKEETVILSNKELQNIIRQRGLVEIIEDGLQSCELKVGASG